MADANPELENLGELRGKLRKLKREQKPSKTPLGGQAEEALPIQSETCNDRALGNEPKRSLREKFDNDAGEALVEVATLSHLKQQIALLPESLQQDILEDISKRLGSVLVDPADLATLRAAAKHIGIGHVSIQLQIKSGKLSTVRLSDGREMIRISDCEKMWPNRPFPMGRPSIK